MALDKITTTMITDAAVTAAKTAADVATTASVTATTALVTAAESDADKIQTNLAILAFKTATTGSLAKYNLKDQIVDEYTNATGIDDTPSNNHILSSSVYSSYLTATSTNATIIESAAYTGDYRSHTFLANGTFILSGSATIDILLVAGGGGAGGDTGGGGGAGGMLTYASQSLAAGTYDITVGAGGADGAASGTAAVNGGNSIFEGLAAAIGGGGGGSGGGSSAVGTAGGSGGGNRRMQSGSGGAGTAGPPRQGYTGGEGLGNEGSAGGGGAGTVGESGGAGGAGTNIGGDGGAGATNAYRTGSNVTYAGGGGGATEVPSTAGGAGGTGGGGAGAGSGVNGTSGTANTGGGGGGGAGYGSNGEGGSGIVVVRYASGFNDIILQSTDTEAEAQPTKADMVMLIEDAGTGVGTVNTHIKGFISRDSGTTFTEGVLVDEGDWGTDKRILAFHDLDISAQPSDQTMCYKITTHSSSAVYDTKIHATSIGWR